MSDIQVKFNVADSALLSAIEATGSARHIITDEERSSFKIGTKKDLYGAVERYFGKSPNEAWLHSPATNGDWEDLYKRYGWDQVQTVLVPERTEILAVDIKPTIIATKQIINDSNKKATFSAKISEQVTNSVEMQWSMGGKLSLEQTISYKVLGIGGETKFGFEANFGSSKTVTQSTTVGTETEVSVELDPGEKAIIELNANSGKMKARITYKAYLIGEVACNYYPKFKDHHFWGLPIGEILGSGNSIQQVEDIEIGFYSNATAKIRSGDNIVKNLEAFIVADKE